MEDKGFEERTKERGIIVREWVNQWEVLKYEAVKSGGVEGGGGEVVDERVCKREGFEETCVKELMEGEKGKEVRKKAMEISDMAKKAMAENGSSWRDLESLL
uniref:Uncharacterized protein n=1 Tax=Cucumis sativus TaxID=3659 RepID=A0A0A0KU36_CUCSA